MGHKRTESTQLNSTQKNALFFNSSTQDKGRGRGGVRRQEWTVRRVESFAGGEGAVCPYYCGIHIALAKRAEILPLERGAYRSPTFRICI